ncbi:hypothetical protein [Congregibacter litoralis]|uniref:Uncharacterized protein n=1 Tax=Congregibacter litoralis KT71 TaxID=314285 RepID=A4A9J8_9GAMM|nr:hypothetical protein [Congregibacter litoralis]EAQ97165.1 hypothetical protein KT71_07294 [Congregibacter litoralis KT71]
MTEPEFLEVINLHAVSAMNAFAIYLSLTFAFLTAIYLIGARLSKAQLIMVGSLYLAWSSSFAPVAIVHLIAFDSLFEEYTAFARTSLWYLPWTEFAVGITLSGIAICGYFVFDIRQGTIGKGSNGE